MKNNHRIKLVVFLVLLACIISIITCLTYVSNSHQSNNDESILDRTSQDSLAIKPISVEADRDAPTIINSVSADDLNEETLKETYELDDETASRIASLHDSKKDKALYDSIKDNPAFETSWNSDGTLNVTMPFAMKDLMISVPEGSLDTSDTKQAEYNDYMGVYIVSYDTMTKTAEKFVEFLDKYGSGNIMVDQPVYACGQSSAYDGWGLQEMGLTSAEDTLDATTGLSNVKVAVIDSGARSTQKVFDGVTIDPLSADFVNSSSINTTTTPNPSPTDSDYSDEYFHGTMVAGIVASGTPDTVSLMILKALDKNGLGSLNDIYYATCYAVNNGANVINYSLAAGLLGDNVDAAKSSQDFFEKELKKAEDSNIFVVSAAGNNGQEIEDLTHVDSDGNKTGAQYPAMSEYSTTISSIGTSHTLSSFSNYGKDVSFTAPGESITGASIDSDDATTVSQGTSFSAPEVTALVADIKTVHPNDSVAEVKQILQDISVDLGDTGKDDKYGYGEPILTSAKLAELLNDGSRDGIKLEHDSSTTITSTDNGSTVLYSTNSTLHEPYDTNGIVAPNYEKTDFDSSVGAQAPDPDTFKKKLAYLLYIGYSSNGGNLYDASTNESDAYTSTQNAIWKLMYDNGISDNNTSSISNDVLASKMYNDMMSNYDRVFLSSGSDATLSITGDTVFRYDKNTKKWRTGILTISSSKATGNVSLSVPNGISIVNGTTGTSASENSKATSSNTIAVGSKFSLTSDSKPSDSTPVSATLDVLYLDDDITQYSPVNDKKASDGKGFQNMVSGSVSTKTLSSNVTVSREDPITSATVSLKWSADSAESRPDNIVIGIIGSNGSVVSGKTVTLSKDNANTTDSNIWNASVSDLPLLDESGSEVSYTFRIISSDGSVADSYADSYSIAYSDNVDGTTLILTKKSSTSGNENTDTGNVDDNNENGNNGNEKNANNDNSGDSNNENENTNGNNKSEQFNQDSNQGNEAKNDEQNNPDSDDDQSNNGDNGAGNQDVNKMNGTSANNENTDTTSGDDTSSTMTSSQPNAKQSELNQNNTDSVSTTSDKDSTPAKNSASNDILSQTGDRGTPFVMFMLVLISAAIASAFAFDNESRK